MWNSPGQSQLKFRSPIFASPPSLREVGISLYLRRRWRRPRWIPGRGTTERRPGWPMRSLPWSPRKDHPLLRLPPAALIRTLGVMRPLSVERSLSSARDWTASIPCSPKSPLFGLQCMNFPPNPSIESRIAELLSVSCYYFEF